ncbi:MAG: hypothetical protein L6R39_005483 [Caloplaca ligustica]|nr:MAG: hypothetical protein L6R39_005483 [Caloplaca ligustica]
MVKFPLTGLSIAATGDFGARRTHETLRRWVEKNGGQWATKMSDQVTHLICTKEDYRSRAPMVKHALKLKIFNIVTYDWLEDSLMKGFRLAPRGDYLVARAIKDAKKVKKVRKKVKKEAVIKGVDDFKKECQDIQKQLFSDRYHVYRDSTFFAYDITLVRVDLLHNKSERYVLRLCTTHDAPHYFATLLTYHTRDSFPAKNVLAPIGSDWTIAFAAFTSAFRAKTKVEWDDRFTPRKWGVDGAFVYQVPKEGEPRGE